MTAPKGFELIPKSPADVAKAIAYSAVAIAGTLAVVTKDDVVTQPELLVVAAAFLGLLGVYWFRGTAAKVGLTFAAAVVQALVLIVTDATGFAAVSLSDWLVVLVTAGAAIGVGIVPNGGQGAKDGRHELGYTNPVAVSLSPADRELLSAAGNATVSIPKSAIAEAASELSASTRAASH